MPNHANSARKALADAIRAQTDATEKLAAAQATLDKGQELLCDLYAQLSEFDLLDQQIDEARANAVRMALERGEAPQFGAMPDGFASKLVARDRVRDDIDALRASLRTLEKNVAIGQQHAKQCALEVEWCAEAVLGEEAEALATDYLAQLDELRATAYLLNAIAMRQVHKGKDAALLNIPSHAGYLSVSSDFRRINMPPVVGEALQENVVGSFERKNGFALRNRMAELANAHWGKLLKDPDAKLDLAKPELAPVARKPNLAALKESEITLQ